MDGQAMGEGFPPIKAVLSVDAMTEAGDTPKLTPAQLRQAAIVAAKAGKAAKS
jgi:hypothetical protein